MCVISEETITDFEALMEQVDEALKTTFQKKNEIALRELMFGGKSPVLNSKLMPLVEWLFHEPNHCH
ncbi:hypothetical protein MTR67_011773 [Solanum verrucosum]|uniref:Uncharacterized protein n=1 Tax=Solanum verrucosum TaxID=315347 RepID=A0AAF0Q8Q1_SOLVR|nr:hypothetical protein MTR67_011773 [Solanum verrucosum]